jgi:hypothetical protein
MVVAKGTLRKPPASSATSKDAGERFKRLESFATKRCSFSGARAEALRTWIAVGCSRCIVHSHRHPAAGWLPARLPSWRSGEGGGGSQERGGRWRGLGRCRRHQFFGDKWHHDSAGMIVSKTPVCSHTEQLYGYWWRCVQQLVTIRVSNYPIRRRLV